MLRNLKRNKQGFVFVMVLVVIITMIILVVSVISVNLTHTMATEGEVKRIQAEQLAIGYRDLVEQLAHEQLDNQNLIQSIGPGTQSNIMDGTTFSTSYSVSITDNSGIHGTHPMTINVIY